MQKRPISAKIVPALILSLGLVQLSQACLAQKELPPQARGLVDRADQLLEKRQFKQAITYLNRAIGSAPQWGSLYLKRGVAYNELGNFQPAIQDFDHALSLDSKLVEAYLGRAWAYDQLDNFEGAVKDYQKYLSCGGISHRVPALCCLADNLGQMGKTDEAIKALDTAIKLEPRCGIAHKQRGSFLNNDTRNPRQAIVDFTVAIEEKALNYRDVYALRASAYTRVKDYPKAVADYTTVMKLSPNDDNAYRQRGAIYELMGDYKKAIEDYSAGIDHNPDWAGPSYFSRARCYNKLGQPELAQKDLAQCKRLNYDGK
jgi:tetratricopeptide (TPR) repeat protein